MPLAALCLLLAGEKPTIDYRVTPAGDLGSIQIQMTVPCQGETVDLRLPNWSPGYYVQENYADSLKEVTATTLEGRPLDVTHPSQDRWHVDTRGTAFIRVTYSRPIAHETGRMGIFSADASTVHYGGPLIYLYVSEHKDWPCRLRFDTPSPVAVALPEQGSGWYLAPDYDTLADSPVTLGAFRVAHYMSRGKQHTLAIRGTAKDKLNLDKALQMTKFISDSETDFFGGSAPYSSYVWHIWAGDTPDGAGGLEHASSSQDFLSTVEGPASMRGLAHECFHLWNVKRIRSSVLGPFDYGHLPRTGALWWLEGVTDYYASLIPHRYGWYGDTEYLKDIARQINDIRRNPQRLTVSPYESSMRVGDAAAGHGNSNGFGVSYYNTGWILGMMFDIELRSRSNNRVSLDDVEHALWNLCRDGKPGFQEGELRRQLVLAGGEEIGTLYDRWVMQPGELPIEAALAKVGLVVTTDNGRSMVSESPSATAAQKALRENWFWGKRQRPSKTLSDTP